MGVWHGVVEFYILTHLLFLICNTASIYILNAKANSSPQFLFLSSLLTYCYINYIKTLSQGSYIVTMRPSAILVSVVAIGLPMAQSQAYPTGPDCTAR
jgi:hypothetical protein